MNFKNEFWVKENDVVRFEYATADGVPPKAVKINDFRFVCEGYNPFDHDPTRGLVWYKKNGYCTF